MLRISTVGNTLKVGCSFAMAISFDFCMRRYRDDDHREEALQFRKHQKLNFLKFLISIALEEIIPEWLFRSPAVGPESLVFESVTKISYDYLDQF